MVGPIHDDFYHILNACSFSENHPGYRLLISRITCALGQSLTSTRIASLICIVLSALLFVKLFSWKDAKKIEIVFAILAISFHPVILFPFFYASQFSTAISVLWAVFSVYCINKLKPPIYICAVMGFSLGILGSFLRFEAIFIFSVVYLCLFAFFTLKKRIRKFFSAEHFVSLIFFLFSISLTTLLAALNISDFPPFYSILLGNFITSQQSETSPKNNEKALTLPEKAPVATSEAQLPFYSPTTHYAVQIWALALYIKNIFMPHQVSFYGPWSDWWRIDQSPAKQRVLYLGFLLLLSSLCIALVGNFFNSLSIRLWILGFLSFLIITFSSSAILRVDWYFVSREYVGAFLFLALSLCAVFESNFLKKQKLCFLLFIVLISSVCSLRSTFVQYKNFGNFLNYEQLITSNKSPQVLLTKGHRSYVQGDLKNAKGHYNSIVDMIPESALEKSATAVKYWSYAQSGAYQTAKWNKDIELRKKIARTLLKDNSFISTSICLQEKSIPLEQCSTSEKKRRFCGTYNSKFFRPDLGFRFLRIPAKEFCGINTTASL